jgi:hypothetical protein
MRITEYQMLMQMNFTSFKTILHKTQAEEYVPKTINNTTIYFVFTT